jgi:hypothetical protein
LLGLELRLGRAREAARRTEDIFDG